MIEESVRRVCGKISTGKITVQGDKFDICVTVRH